MLPARRRFDPDFRVRVIPGRLRRMEWERQQGRVGTGRQRFGLVEPVDDRLRPFRWCVRAQQPIVEGQQIGVRYVVVTSTKSSLWWT
jgi:hypothetical protein